MDEVLSLQMLELRPDVIMNANSAQSMGSCNSNACSAMSVFQCTATDTLF